MNKKYIVIQFFALLFCLAATAQNVSSPYSILGIGDIENNDYGRYSASGSAAVSRREVSFYNFSNPASLTVMQYKGINFDFGFRGRVSKFKLPGTDTLTAASKDFVVKRVSIAFKVTPKSAFAFGLKPFSSVNYQYLTSSSYNDGNTDLIKYADGSGGIYQSYFSYAKEFGKRVSIGATASWLFGSLQDSSIYFNQNINLDVSKSEKNFYNAAGLQMGLQYYTLPGKSWQHTFGITASAFTALKGQSTSNYTENNVTIKTPDPVNIQFKLPLTVSAAYSITHTSGLSFHLQGNYAAWPVQYLYYQNSFTKSAYSVNVGMEYVKKVTTPGYTSEKYYVGWGIRMAQSYLSVNNTQLNDFAVTLGAGKILSSLLSVNGGIEAGQRGTATQGQIQENYFQFNIGITLKSFWYGTKKFGRFN